MTYFIVFIHDDNESEWCIFETKDSDYALKVFYDICTPPEYKKELRKTYEPLETYRTYEVIVERR